MNPIKKGLALLLVIATLSLLSACSATNSVMLCDYKNITIPATVSEVANEDVQLAVRMKLFEMDVLIPKSENATLVEYGDTVTLSIASADCTPEEISITIGDEEYLPGLDQQLIGKNAHQSYNVMLGDTVYTVKIQAVATSAEDLTDQLARQYFGAPSAESVLAQTKQEIIQHRTFDFMYTYLLNHSLLRKTDDRAKYIQAAVARLESAAEQHGTTLDKYVETVLGTTLSDYALSAGAFFDEYLILEALIRNEGIEVPEDEYLTYLQVFAEDRGISPDEALAVYGEEVIRYVLYFEKSYSVLLRYTA